MKKPTYNQVLARWRHELWVALRADLAEHGIILTRDKAVVYAGQRFPIYWWHDSKNLWISGSLQGREWIKAHKSLVRPGSKDQNYLCLKLSVLAGIYGQEKA